MPVSHSRTRRAVEDAGDVRAVGGRLFVLTDRESKEFPRTITPGYRGRYAAARQGFRRRATGFAAPPSSRSCTSRPLCCRRAGSNCRPGSANRCLASCRRRRSSRPGRSGSFFNCRCSTTPKSSPAYSTFMPACCSMSARCRQAVFVQPSWSGRAAPPSRHCNRRLSDRP
jgi:hypothetical protein